jgi:hypothetical protein
MGPFKTAAVVEKDGTLTLDHLPFRAGERVEVVVTPIPPPRPDTVRYPLRGSVLHYDDPTEPVAEGDWEALS